jgi:hypothetical protein
MAIPRSLRTRILYGVLGLLGVNALLGLAVVLAGSLSGTAGRVIGSSFLLAGGCLLALSGSTVMERARLLAVATICANALATVLLLVLLWTSDPSEGLVRATVALCCASVDAAVTSLLVSRARPNGPTGIRGARVLALVAFGTLALLGVLGAAGALDGSDGAVRAAGAAAILGVSGVLAIPVLRATDRSKGQRAPAARPMLDELVGLRVVAVNGVGRDVLVFENGARVRSS